LAKARDLNAFQKPSKRDYRAFRTWFYNIKPLNYEPEEEFIKRKEDLITLRHGREWSGFDGFIESCVRKMHCGMTQVSMLDAMRDPTDVHQEAFRHQRTSREDQR
jgi:hypothetical protein